MTVLEEYHLALDTLTAIGTVGAVIISLWLTVRKTPRFVIRKIEMSTEVNLDSKRKVKTIEHFLSAKVENLDDVKMQVFSVAVQAVDKPKKKSKAGMYNCGLTMPLQSIYIPAKSIYSVRVPVDSDYEVGTFSNAKDVTCTISTSFGDKEVKFPKEWRERLCEAVEKPREKAAA